MTHITIIGGGVSGVFLAIQLMRSKTDLPLAITLVEKEKEPWLGVAYSTDKPFHLLNVRASRMSALQGEDDHFLDWLHRHKYDTGPNDFAPRFVFRKYVEDILQTTLNEKPANIEFTWLRNSVIDLKQINDDEGSSLFERWPTVCFEFYRAGAWQLYNEFASYTRSCPGGETMRTLIIHGPGTFLMI
jgi:uncharacterized NAD(P)/FAD-binding protein YdhS